MESTLPVVDSSMFSMPLISFCCEFKFVVDCVIVCLLERETDLLFGSGVKSSVPK